MPIPPRAVHARQRYPTPVMKGTEARESDFPIIGIGCSAGGLEAFERFFAQVPADSGMAFVVVQHLDPWEAATAVGA